jgi:hypothetical protein
MSLPKKIAAMVVPLVSIAFLLAVPASAQNAPAASSKNQADSSAPTAEAPKKKVMAHRHSWTKKHEPKTASGTKKPPKAKSANASK